MPNSVGSYMATMRQKLGLTRRALADAVGVSTQEVAWWESEDHLPDAGIIEDVAAALHTQVDFLYLNTGWIPPHRITAFESALKGERLETPGESDLYSNLEQSPAIFSTGLGKVLKGDCIQVMRRMPGRSVDCIFADPPFNLRKDYGPVVKDNLSDRDYLEWSYKWMAEAVRLLKYGGSLFLYNLPKWNIHLASYLDRFLQFRHWIAVDIKFSLPIQGRLYPSHYSLLYFVKASRPRTFNPPRLPIQTCRHCGGEIRDYGGYKNKMNPRGVNLTDVWNDIPPVRHKRYKKRGANELALKMLDRVMDISTRQGDVVLDPFAGSGTTLAACELKNRRWIGIELGDCGPMIERLSSLDKERQQLASLQAEINTLFTPETLALRNKNGHDTSPYRLLPEMESMRAGKKAGSDSDHEP